MSDSFPEKVPVTYCAGNVSLDMSEENIDTQSAVKTGIYSTLLPLVKEADFGEIYTDGVLLCNETADVSNNPDGVAARWVTIESKRLSFIIRKDSRRALEGTPDWVMEIVSDSSVGKDLRQLRGAYHKAGIEEYWLIDARGNEINFQILAWQHTGYVSTTARDGWIYSKIFDREFRLTRTRNRIGGWSYSLEMRRKNGKSKSR
jgi:Uma2 family endonuclease